MICPICRAPIGRGWEPHRILDGLSITWRCPNGHAGQVNGVEVIWPPLGKPDPAKLP